MKACKPTVKLLNPEVLEKLYENHGTFACVCYNTSEDHAESVGKSCQASGHMSGSRCEYIKFRIDNVDRGTAEQCLRHEIGTHVPFEMQDNYSFADEAERVLNLPADSIVKNMASFRYIDKDGFDYAIPSNIEYVPEAKEKFISAMEAINAAREQIRDVLLENKFNSKSANEAVNFLLPRATTTSLVIAFTPEALIHFCHKRMCVRAQEFINQIAYAIRSEVYAINPNFAAELKPQCQHLLWCPEGKHGCGRMPSKEKLVTGILEGRLIK